MFGDSVFSIVNAFSNFFDGNEFPTGIDWYSPNTSLPVDVYTTKEKKDIVFKIAIAGYLEGDVEVDFADNTMIVSLKDFNKDKSEGDKSTKIWIKRSIKKSNQVLKFYLSSALYDFNKTVASISNGILEIIVPAKDEQNLKRKVHIEVK